MMVIWSFTKRAEWLSYRRHSKFLLIVQLMYVYKEMIYIAVSCSSDDVTPGVSIGTPVADGIVYWCQMVSV